MDYSTQTKRKRTRLALSEQVEATRMLWSSTSTCIIIRQFKISRRTMTSICQHYGETIRHTDKMSALLNAKTWRSMKLSKMNESELRFFALSRSFRFPITQNVIVWRIVLVRDRLSEAQEPTEVQRNRLKSFSSSKGWVIRFIQKHSLRSVALHGKAGSVSTTAVTFEMTLLRQDGCKYYTESVFNVDETDLFFKLIPRQPYISQTKNFKSLGLTRAMKAKQRIAVCVCKNTILVEMPVVVIEKSRTQAALELVSLLFFIFHKRMLGQTQLSFKSGTLIFSFLSFEHIHWRK